MTQDEFFKRFTYSVRNDKIGGGGFGTVYKAYDNTLHREVAIKVSEVKTTADGKKTFSLKDEFEALSHVPKHPNIANYEEFYSFEMPNGVFDYAIMQYYPNGNLSEAIHKGLTFEQKEDIALQLLDGIDFLHDHKVVHRDLKPGNILIVRHSGKIIPLITDFGLSKTADAGDRSLFSNSFGGGTARYSSPEQLQGKPLRMNTDLWSYGAIVFELFTGKPLFEAGSSAINTAQADLEIYNKIIHGDTEDRLSDIPDKWRKVLECCMVVDPEKRAKSAKELRETLFLSDDETIIDNNFEKEDSSVGTDSDDKTILDTGTTDKAKNVQKKTSPKPDFVEPIHAQTSKTSSKKRLPWIIGGAVALFLILCIVISTSNKDKSNESLSNPTTNDTCYTYQNDSNNNNTTRVLESKPAGENAAPQNSTSPNQNNTTPPNQNNNLKQDDNDSKIYNSCDQMPEYPGGPEAMYAFLTREIQYPEIARNNNIRGTVLVSFVVEKDGRVTNVKTIVPLFPECDKEAIRAVKAMPKWKPGYNKGKPVRCYEQLPVTFKQ